jgi:hypothetical protein
MTSKYGILRITRQTHSVLSVQAKRWDVSIGRAAGIILHWIAGNRSWDRSLEDRHIIPLGTSFTTIRVPDDPQWGRLFSHYQTRNRPAAKTLSYATSVMTDYSALDDGACLVSPSMWIAKMTGKVPSRVTVHVPGRDVLRLRSISEKWDMTMSEVIRILIRTHPSLDGEVHPFADQQAEPGTNLTAVFIPEPGDRA